MILPETPAGWILGTECGYENHTGFVKDAGNMQWSLTPLNDRLWCLALIDNGVAISSKTMSLESAIEYVK
jgi:hypothetical protein